jgi:hypothetical protein
MTAVAPINSVATLRTLFKCIVAVSLLAPTLSSCATRKVMTTGSYDLPSGFPSMHDLPSGLGVSAIRDAARFIEEVSRMCDEAEDMPESQSPWTADVAIIGTVAGAVADHRLTVAFNSDLGRSASARIESATENDKSFVLVTAGGPATLLLEDGSRFHRAPRFAAVLSAIADVELDAWELGRLIRGCLMSDSFGYVTDYGDSWRRLSFGRNGKMYFHQDSPGQAWQMRTVFYPGKALNPSVRVDYHNFEAGIPRTILVNGISSVPMTLALRLVSLDVRVSLPPEVFQVEVPPSGRPITISEIRAGRLFRR